MGKSAPKKVKRYAEGLRQTLLGIGMTKSMKTQGLTAIQLRMGLDLLATEDTADFTDLLHYFTTDLDTWVSTPGIDTFLYFGSEVLSTEELARLHLALAPLKLLKKSSVKYPKRWESLVYSEHVKPRTILKFCYALCMLPVLFALRAAIEEGRHIRPHVVESILAAMEEGSQGLLELITSKEDHTRDYSFWPSLRQSKLDFESVD